MTSRSYIGVLIFISGMGGFLYGYDIGIIGAALLYLNKTISLTLTQESLIVAAVLAGGTLSSLAAGALADFIGRKRLMVAAACLFLVSVVLIVIARGFTGLFVGRTLQGFSAGMIAVVIPLYLAESLPAAIRGRGTAAFQFFLTIGILLAMAVGRYHTAEVEALAPGAGAEAVQAAQDNAWRAMFLSALWPGLVFLGGSLLVTESPRWLLRRGRTSDARDVLARSRTKEEADREFIEMRASAVATATSAATPGTDRIWQRRYLVPFFMTCTVLGLTQATGINSILQFVVVILQEAGLAATDAAGQATAVTAVNVVFTVVGLVLVDKLGRQALLKIGTVTIALSLIVAAVVFWRIQSGALAPSPATGKIVTACLMLFVAGFATGPGVCVWLALSELMPMRIRSLGMGIGLLLNQGISTAFAAMFLPVVKNYGYSAIFAFWALCTVGYFFVVALWLPETKGRTLEQIEAEFAK